MLLTGISGYCDIFSRVLRNPFLFPQGSRAALTIWKTNARSRLRRCYISKFNL